MLFVRLRPGLEVGRVEIEDVEILELYLSEIQRGSSFELRVPVGGYPRFYYGQGNSKVARVGGG